MQEENFQGWTNRETWATNLWITNDQALYELARDYASTALQEHQGEDHWQAQYCLEETLRSWIEEDLLTLENIKGNRDLWMMLTDIGSLYRVSWKELSEYYLNEIKEEVEA